MARALVLLATGIAIGAVGTYYLARSPAAPRSAAGGRLPSPPQTGIVGTGSALAHGLSIAQRRAVYDMAARADAATLKTRLSEAAAAAPSAERRFTLGVLLARYAEIDPARAVRFARGLGLARTLWAPLYETWAARDPRSALAALRGLDDPTDARFAALALMRGLGGDGKRNVERVMAALPGDAQPTFLLYATATIAQTSPADALDLALTLQDGSAVRTAIRGVAAVWAQRDPQAALAAAASIKDPAIKKRFEDDVLAVWASKDPVGLLAYAGTTDRTLQPRLLAVGLLQNLSLIKPQRVLKLADHLSGDIAQMVRSQAVQNLALRDPGAAVAYVDALPPGATRQRLLRRIARGYGRSQPDAALDWARDLQPPDPQVLAGVIAGIAQTDPDRALELALAETSAAARQQALQSVALIDTYDSAEEAHIANRLVTQPADPASQSALRMLTLRWTNEDPAGALDWMLANVDRLGAAAFVPVAEAFARQDPQKATLYTARIPQRVRPAWIKAVAYSYAQVDAPAASDWVAQFRGQPGYDAAAGTVARLLAQSDPQAAANLLQSIAHPTIATASDAAGIATQYAQSDPHGAAQWALSLKGTQTERLAVTAAVLRWAIQDVQSARNWVLALPPNQNRDYALSALVTAAARDGTPDQSLLDAFSNDKTRQQAVRVAVSFIARRDAGQARTFADAQITDPKLRRSAEQLIDQATGNSFSIGVRAAQSSSAP